MLLRALTVVCVLTLPGVVADIRVAQAQYYSPGYQPLPIPPYSAQGGQRFVPLYDEDDTLPPRPRGRALPRPLALPGARTAAPRGPYARDPYSREPYADIDNSYDLYSEPQLRDRPRRGSRNAIASLPSDADPAYSSGMNYDDEVDTSRVTGRVIADPTRQAAGTLTVNTRVRKLYLSLGGGQAMEYGIGVGRQGFEWKGAARIGRKAVWPGWTPPKEMILRRPDLPEHMEGGLDNPLGARALYLFKGAKDTLFRIHGTNEPNTIGRAVSSGCIRMLNADVIDLYQRVPKGANVVVI